MYFPCSTYQMAKLKAENSAKQFLGYLQLDIAFLAYYGVCALRIRNVFIVQYN